MDYEELSELNKEFADLTAQMTKEFTALFQKWLRKHPRVTIVNSVHLPLNLILNLIAEDHKNILPHMMPDLPNVFMRFAYPFSKIKNNWGKISGEEFVKAYGVEHGKLFGKMFESEEAKQQFLDWYKHDTKKHKQNHSG